MDLAWQPFDPFTSEDASARLRRAMPFPHLWYDGEYWYCAPDYGNHPEMECPDKDDRIAIVLAALKWLELGELED